MNIVDMNIVVDKLPDGCSVTEPNEESCVFNQHKYCVLKMALKESNTFVQNNRGIVPDDCPLRTQWQTN